MSEISSPRIGLLPNPFNSGKINSNQTITSSFLSPFNSNRDGSTFLPWYNASDNFNSAKIEDPTIKKPKWDNGPPATRVLTPKPFQKQANFQRNTDLYCDTCDKSFRDEMSYLKHQAEHINCNIEGCKFRAHPKIVALHKKMQHQTGLAKKIMSLDTPEDIDKWREDRKRNFPTTENIEKRKQELEEKKARGEILGNKFFGKMRGRGRGRGNKFNNNTRGGNDDLANQDTNRNGRGRFRGRGFRGGGRFRGNQRTGTDRDHFKGTNIVKNYDELMKSVLKEIEIKKDTKLSEDKSEGELDSDSDKEINSEIISSPKENKLDTEISIENQLTRELNNLDEKNHHDLKTTSQSMEEIEKKRQNNNETSNVIKTKEIESEIIIKEDIKVAGGALGSLMANYGSDSDSENEPVEISSKIIPQFPPKPKIEARKVPAPNLYPMRKRQTSLLEKLLANEIRHERNVILQCVHHIVRNNFFESVNVENKDSQLK